jgi:hypothetical protein
MDISAGGYIAFSNGDKWGFINTEGIVVIEPQYEDAKSFSNGLAAVQVDGKWGYINAENKLVIRNQFVFADYMTQAGSCMISEDEGSYKLLTLVFS